jgi:hypothetical protein
MPAVALPHQVQMQQQQQLLQRWQQQQQQSVKDSSSNSNLCKDSSSTFNSSNNILCSSCCLEQQQKQQLQNSSHISIRNSATNVHCSRKEVAAGCSKRMLWAHPSLLHPSSEDGSTGCQMLFQLAWGKWRQCGSLPFHSWMVMLMTPFAAQTLHRAHPLHCHLMSTLTTCLMTILLFKIYAAV